MAAFPVGPCEIVGKAKVNEIFQSIAMLRRKKHAKCLVQKVGWGVACNLEYIVAVNR